MSPTGSLVDGLAAVVFGPALAMDGGTLLEVLPGFLVCLGDRAEECALLFRSMEILLFPGGDFLIPDEEGFGLAALVEGEAILWECGTGVTVRLRWVQETKMCNYPTTGNCYKY